MPHFDAFPIERLLNTDIERLYQAGRRQHRASHRPLRACLDEKAQEIGFPDGFASLVWHYEHAIQHAFSHMTLVGLYTQHPLAARWVLRQLADELSQELGEACTDWERYATVFYEDSTDTVDAQVAFYTGFVDQPGWHVLPTFPAYTSVMKSDDGQPFLLLVATVGYPFLHGETQDTAQRTPLEVATHQFRCGEPVLMLTEDAGEPDWEESLNPVSYSDFEWSAPTPRRCYIAIEAALKRRVLQQAYILTTDERPERWAMTPKKLNDALKKYRRAS